MKLGRLTLGVLALPLVLSTSCSDSSPTPDRPNDDGYDYVVVGSGAGGGPVAARLARSGKKVLLLEAGADVGGTPKHDVPAMHALATEDERMAWWFFVSHHADAKLDREDSKYTADGILYPRGSALGGSTAVNAMVTVLPSRSDWNRLASITGDASFRADAMDRFYDRVREWLSVELPAPSLLEGDPVVTGELLSAARVADSSIAGLASATKDINASLRVGETTGFFRLPLATKNGRRSGPRELVLDTVAKGYPLTVKTGAFVTRVLFDGTRATGVEFVAHANVYGASLKVAKAPDERHEVHARREVILAAGAFNSPQLLKLSGVGGEKELGEHGITPVVDRAAVGENLQDRYEAPLVTELDRPIQLIAKCKLDGPPDADPCFHDWQQGRGVYTTPGFLATVLARSTPDAPLADLQIFAVPSDARGYYPSYSTDGARARNRFSWLVLKAHTKNKDGSVRLASASPFTRPRIAFRSFDEKDPLHDPDLLAVVRGLRIAREIQATANDTIGGMHEVWPGPDIATDEQLAAFARREAWGHHACCTDRMGRADDPEAVVDPKFRVIGVSGLRVVDASVFPEIPGTFIALPMYMLAEKAAETILEDAR